MIESVTARQFHADPSVAEWRVVGDGACTRSRTGSFAESTRLVQAIGGLPDLDDHAPDMDVRRDGVTIRLITRKDEYAYSRLRTSEPFSPVGHSNVPVSVPPSAEAVPLKVQVTSSRRNSPDSASPARIARIVPRRWRVWISPDTRASARSSVARISSLGYARPGEVAR